MNRLSLVLLTSALLGFFSSACASYSSVLSTPRRVVVIVVTCPEGDIDCDDVRFVGVDKVSGATTTLSGADWVRMCEDRVTPCQHLGFKFSIKDVTYYVSDGGELTEVTRAGDTTLDEVGKWLER